ncbi:hypothetical protein [Actinomadura sp. WMMB 499]|uniref:hypothetical protein n=1 Tax=Actinomadura sp. WMMB 499 TaxID=1219491 RepID=UPI00159DCC18|nr:hypothetical protein [Actinomadura sp. WMMB 499]
MPKGTVLQVESHPSRPDAVDEFDRWYDEVPLREVLSADPARPGAHPHPTGRKRDFPGV